MAMVGLNKTVYNVSEDVGVVQVCAVVDSLNSTHDCLIDFPFNISLASNGSAGIIGRGETTLFTYL